MNTLKSRRLLQLENNVSQVASPAPTTGGGGDAMSCSSTAAAFRRPFSPETQLDSSMALTIIVLLTAFFFMGLFSVYIRRSSDGDASPNHEGGLEAAAVNSLPVVAYAKQQMMEECPICLSEFQERESVRLIPYCGHVFHRNCIDTWLVSHVTCPVCRSDQLFKTVEEGWYGKSKILLLIEEGSMQIKCVLTI